MRHCLKPAQKLNLFAQDEHHLSMAMPQLKTANFGWLAFISRNTPKVLGLTMMCAANVSSLFTYKRSRSLHLKIKEGGVTLIPLQLYFNNGKAIDRDCGCSWKESTR